jgi:hypothetical protein
VRIGESPITPDLFKTATPQPFTTAGMLGTRQEERNEIVKILGEEITRLHKTIGSLKKRIFKFEYVLSMHVTPLTPLPIAPLPRKARARRTI